jgi:serine/threonine protein kinase
MPTHHSPLTTHNFIEFSMLLFAQAHEKAQEVSLVPHWLFIAAGLLCFLVVFVSVIVLVFLLTKRNPKPRSERRCAGCGARLAAGAAGEICSRCVAILSASQLGAAPSGPLGGAVSGDKQEGIRVGAPGVLGLADPGSPQTEAYAGPVMAPELAGLAVRFPNLEIIELLGKGGMGAVYKARQTKLDRLVALKVLPGETGRDTTFAERFLREARALARLNHPGIVAVHDFGEADGLLYFVMEFVEGANLRQIIRSGNLAADQCLAIVAQVCEALQYAHNENIIHRDIKPENILLDKRGRAKIADFGLAKLLGPERIDHTLTATQQAMGTLHYMAPEQLESAAKVDHRADIYSLGVVFYEMLTGQVPRGNFAPPSHKAKVDTRLDAVVMRALQSEPERRYQQVREMQTAVEAITQPGGVRDVAGVTAPFVESNVGSPSFQSALRKVPLNLDVQAIKRQLEAPALWLLVIGLLTALLSLPAIVGTITNVEQRLIETQTTVLLFSLLNLPIGVLVILGSRKMMSLELFGMALLGCIVAMLPCSPIAVLGIPIGIWALMILLQPRVRAAFRSGLDSAPDRPMPIAATRLLNGPQHAMLAASLGPLIFGILCVWGTGSTEEMLAQAFWLLVVANQAFWLLVLPNFLVAALMIMASGSMRSGKSHALARLGSMLALLPLNPFVVVTFPIGLWALRALQKPEVKAAFGLPADESN